MATLLSVPCLTICSYKGKYNVKFDFVRDICPPPQNNGMHYLVLDIDPGLSSQVGA